MKSNDTVGIVRHSTSISVNKAVAAATGHGSNGGVEGHQRKIVEQLSGNHSSKRKQTSKASYALKENAQSSQAVSPPEIIYPNRSGAAIDTNESMSASVVRNE